MKDESRLIIDKDYPVCPFMGRLEPDPLLHQIDIIHIQGNKLISSYASLGEEGNNLYYIG